MTEIENLEYILDMATDEMTASIEYFAFCVLELNAAIDAEEDFIYFCNHGRFPE